MGWQCSIRLRHSSELLQDPLLMLCLFNSAQRSTIAMESILSFASLFTSRFNRIVSILYSEQYVVWLVPACRSYRVQVPIALAIEQDSLQRCLLALDQRHTTHLAGIADPPQWHPMTCLCKDKWAGPSTTHSDLTFLRSRRSRAEKARYSSHGPKLPVSSESSRR